MHVYFFMSRIKGVFFLRGMNPTVPNMKGGLFLSRLRKNLAAENRDKN